jgi:hypothetical protein
MPMMPGLNEFGTPTDKIASTVYDKCIIKLALADAGGKFRRQEGGAMCGAKHESTLVRSPCLMCANPDAIEKRRCLVPKY